MRFIETPTFTRQVATVLPDDDYRRLQEVLLRRPLHGDLIKETGGLRKIRWAEAGRGKRGSLRIIYYWHPKREIFLMLPVSEE